MSRERRGHGEFQEARRDHPPEERFTAENGSEPHRMAFDADAASVE